MVLSMITRWSKGWSYF